MANKKTVKQKQLISGIVGDITFSDSDVWVWMKIPSAQYEFQDYQSRERVAHDFDLALSNLLSSDEKALDCHLIVSSKKFDSDNWISTLFDRSLRNHPSKHLPDFFSQMHSRVEQFGFREKIVLLGVRLGFRSEFSATRSALMLGPINDLLAAFGGVVDEYMSDKEYNFWNTRAKSVRGSLAGSRVKAEEVVAEELAYVIRKNFFPAMPAPDDKELALGNSERWGIGEIGSLFDAEIENNSKWLRICQVVDGQKMEGYRATLCFNKFPEVLAYPERSPWIHFAAALDFSADIYSRFTLEPSRKVRKEVSGKLKEMQDQARNQNQANQAVSMQVQENLILGEELDFALSKSTLPWVFGRHRLVVEASSEEELRERVQDTIDHYKTLDILLSWPSGDQMNLLIESMPNDKVRVPAYYQRQELSIISAGAPTGGGTVGDMVERRPNGDLRGWIGPYMGYTTGTTVEPVFISPHSNIGRDKPPGLVITGSPGAGKSYTAFTFAYEMALQGIWTVYIDPKGDAVPIVKLPGMETSRLLDLKDGNDGILDPFSIGETRADQLELAVETISLLLGGQANLSPERQTALAKAIDKVAGQEEPSLSKVVDMLLESPDPNGEALGYTLNFMRQLPFARLCFSARGGATLRPDQGLTVITLLGLDLPNAQLTPENYSNPNRLAVAVMYLLTRFTRELMMNLDKSHPKAIMIDEAWAITSTPQGQKMVLETARMGRSLNTALVLVSQNAGDFLGGPVLNSVATKMAFRSNQPDEIENVLKFFNLEVNEPNSDVIRELRNGECIVQDSSLRISRVQIDGWSKDMSYAFETNPETRKNNESR